MALNFLNNGYFAGSVGIGTDSPQTGVKLDVRGNVRIGDGSSAEQDIHFNNSTTEWQVGTNNAGNGTDNNQFYFYEGGNYRLTVQKGGNVGIGTTSPSAKLEINGVTRISGDFAGTGQNPLIQLYNTDTSLGADQILGDIDFYQSDPSGGGAGVVGRIRSINDSSFKGEASLTFSTGEVGVSFQEQMRITSTGDVGIGATPTTGYKLDVVRTTPGYSIVGSHASGGKVGIYSSTGDNGIGTINNYNFNLFTNNSAPQVTLNTAGNVGIGTTGPGASLHVAGAIASAPTGTGVLMGMESNYAVVHLNGASGGIIEFSTSGVDRKGRILYNNASNYMQIQTNGSDKVRIDSSGNVGIGTTSPLNKTHIVGPTLATGTETSYGLAVSDVGDQTKTLILGYDLVNDVGIIQAIDQQTAWKNLAFGISGNSKVGIGTVSPGSKLEISGPTGSYLSGIGFSATGTGARTYRTYIGTNGYFYFDDVTGGSSRLTIDTGGNVGIGTTNPPQKLAVIGNISLGNYNGSDFSRSIGINDSSGTYGNGSSYIKFNELSGSGTSGTTKGAAIEFYNHLYAGNTNQTMIIQANGNVGIGVTGPSAKLSLYNATEDVSINVNTGTGGSYPKKTGISFGATSTSLGGDAEFTGGAGIQAINTAASNNITDLAFWTTTGGSPAERMRISSAGAIKFNAYGAGTLVTDASGNITVSSGGGVGGPYLPLSAGSGFPLTGALYLGNVGGDQKIQFQRTGGNVYSIEHDAAQLYFYNRTTTETPLLIQNDGDVLMNAGNVGIGTTSPVNKLNVSGDIGYTGVIGQGSIYGNTGNSSFSTMQLYDPATGYTTLNNQSYGYYFNTSGGTKVTILNSGNVGIGTTSPDYLLDLSKTAVSDTYSGINLQASNYGYTIEGGLTQNIGGELIFSSNNAGTRNPRVKFAANGNVGIGTTSPERKLHVFAGESNGAASNAQSTLVLENSTNTYLQFLTPASSESGILFGDTDNDRGGLTYSHSSDAMNFRVAAETKMYINSSGNVGIGTTSPDGALSVENTGTAGVPVLDIINTSNAQFNHSGEMMTPNMLANQNNIFVIGRQSTTKESGYIGYKWSSSGSNSNVLTFGHWGSDNLMNIDGLGNVGIGTTSPSNPLEISSTTSAQLRLTRNAGTAYSTLYSDSAGGLIISSYSSGSSNYQIFSINSSEKLRIINNGNVGIGTTLPGAALEVNAQGTGNGIGGYTSFKTKYGTSSVQSLSMGQVTAGNGAWIGMAQYRNGGYWQTEGTAAGVISLDAGGNIAFATNTGLTANTDYNITERMRIDTAGAIRFNSYGAGTLVTDASGNITVSSGGGAGGPYLPLAGGTMDASANINMNSGTLSSVDYIDFGIAQLNGVSTSIFQIKSLGDIYYNVDSNNNGNSSHIFQESGSELMRIRYDGNVGIGTTSPDALLEISGNAGADPGPITNPTTFRITDAGNAATGAGDTVNPWGKIEFYSEDVSSTGPSVQAQIASVYNTIYSNSSDLHFYTRANPAVPLSTRMTIEGAGNVGIGTTNPVYTLDVVSAGDGLLSLTGGTKPAMIFKVGTAVVGGIQAQANTSLNVSAYGTSSLNLQTAGTTPRLTILTGGAVGIGETSPSATLHVKNTVGSYPFIVETPYDRVGKLISTDAGAELIIQDSSSTDNGNSISVSGDTMTLRTANSNRIRILANGNVGIGLTNPTSKLQVASAASGPAVKIDNTSATGGNGLEVNGGSNSGGHALKIGDYNGSFKMIVQGTGNVGIGALASSHST